MSIGEKLSKLGKTLENKQEVHMKQFEFLLLPLIMLTSLAPSPIASVTAFLYFLTSSTT